MMLTEKEKQLLRQLRRNSRKNLAELSREINIPSTTLFDILRKLEKKVIVKHVPLLDYSKVGHSLKVSFAVTAKKKEELREYLLTHPNVNTMSALIGGHDFFIECVFRNMKEYTEFREAFEKYEATDVDDIFIIDELKKEGFVV